MAGSDASLASDHTEDGRRSASAAGWIVGVSRHLPTVETRRQRGIVSLSPSGGAGHMGGAARQPLGSHKMP